MSKETNTTNIEVTQFKEGVQLVTTQTAQFTEVFNSPEESIDEKDVDAWKNKSSGAIMVAIGVTGFIGSTYLAFESEGDTERFIASMGSMLASYFISEIGSKLYKAGELARSQYHKLKEVTAQPPLPSQDPQSQT